jgi:hypothetical protein
MPVVDLAQIENIHRRFSELLQGLESIWPIEDVNYVREEIAHGEYGDALENLIALGVRNGLRFGPQRTNEIELLASAMGNRVKPGDDGN